MASRSLPFRKRRAVSSSAYVEDTTYLTCRQMFLRRESSIITSVRANYPPAPPARRRRRNAFDCEFPGTGGGGLKAPHAAADSGLPARECVSCAPVSGRPAVWLCSRPDGSWAAHAGLEPWALSAAPLPAWVDSSVPIRG